MLILHAAGVGLTDSPAVISGRYNKYHSLQLQNYYAHFPPLLHTHIWAKHNYAELVMSMIMGFEALLSTILFIVYVDTLLSRLESSGFGCFVGDEYFGSMCYADDVTLLAPTFASLKSMIKICEKFGKEFDLTFNASKTVCIYFPGKRRYRENPPTLYMNDKALPWVKSVKHIGNIVTWDLREVEEISKKRCDFIGRTNSLLANFKSIQKEIISRVFLSQCCHMYGSQAWALDACHIKIFCSTWRKAIRKLWGLPNIARSALVPHLVNASQ